MYREYVRTRHRRGPNEEAPRSSAHAETMEIAAHRLLLVEDDGALRKSLLDALREAEGI